MPSTQTSRKRKLGAALAELRTAAKIETADVVVALRKSPGTLSKIENGHVKPDWPTLTVLLALYQPGVEQREKIETLWHDAAESRSKIEHSAAMGPKYRAFLRSEADAESLKNLQQTVIPGLLQTARYAKAIHDAAETAFAEVKGSAQRSVSSRLARQARLSDPNAPLQFSAVIDEAVIHRRVGGDDVMIEQLRHLLEVAELPNVAIRVLPHDAGAYPTMMSPVTILGFDDPESPDTVYLEHQVGGQWIDKADEVAQFAKAFELAEAQALSTQESVALIRRQLERPEGK